MNWFIQNIGTITVSVILTAAIALIMYKLLKDRKNGKSSCGCNCSHCALHGECHK